MAPVVALPSVVDLEDSEALAAFNAELEGLTAEERVQRALDIFGEGLVVSTSFGIQAAVMLHLVSRRRPDVPVVWVDTGYLFPETYRYAEQLTNLLSLNLKVYQPLMTPARQEALFGKRWEQGKDGLTEYGLMNKVEPMNRALRELGANTWLSGLRRTQATTRQSLHVLEKQKRTWKAHPILDWSERDIYQYMIAHDLPQHPLWAEGYVSVGDWHSTSRLEEGMTAEQTRFNGVKRECGLHEISGRADYQI